LPGSDNPELHDTVFTDSQSFSIKCGAHRTSKLAFFCVITKLKKASSTYEGLEELFIDTV